jgi:hypothetical protein
MKYSGAMKPQAGVVYGHEKTGLYTNDVRTLGSVWEGRRALVIVRSGKMCTRFKAFGYCIGDWKIMIREILIWLGMV